MSRYLVFVFLFVIVGLPACSGGSKEEFYLKGQAEIDKANPNGAIVFFKNALERDPNYFAARYALARAFMVVGKNQLAENEFNKAVLQDPERNQVKLDLAKLYAVNQKADLAIRETEAYVQTHGASAESNELLGIASVLQNKPAEAESYLLQALTAEPDRTSVKRELATIYVQFRLQGKEPAARRLINEILQSDPKDTGPYYLLAMLETAAGNKAQALTIYRKIVEIDPADANALYRAGILLVGQGDLVAAAQATQQLLQKFPGRAEGLRLSGIVNYQNKKYPEAITDLLRSLGRSPADEAVFYLGLSYYAKGDLESALSQFFKLCDKTVYAEPARLLVGMILLKQQRLDDAITETKKLLAVQPGNALGHNILGSALMAKGLYDEGMKEFNRAIELDPTIVDAHLKKGVFHLREGRVLDAERDFTSAVQAAPDLLNTRQILSCFYLRENRPDRASSLLQEGLTGQKSDAALYDNLASVQFAQSKRKEGLAYLLKARAIDPDYLAAAFHLASYYAAAGEAEKALTQYQGLVQKDPRNLRAWLNMAALLEFNNRTSEAFDAYRRARATGDPAAHLALAGYLLRQQQENEALVALDEAIRSVPRNLEARQLKFRVYMKRKVFKEALAIADEIESLDPQIGLRRKVEVYVGMQDEAQALAEAERYSTLNPNSALGFMLQAMVHEHWNEIAPAIAAMEQGLRADRGNVAALVQLGNLHARQKDYTAAQSHYAEALRKDANAVDALFAQGTLLELSGATSAAIKKYQEVLQKSEDHVPALNNLAYLYVTGHGSPQEGLRLAFHGFRQEPGNPQVMDTLGLALLKNSRSDDARKVLEKSAALLPDRPTVAYHLALACRDSGRKEQAVEILREIAGREDFPEAKESQELYRQLVRGGS